MKTLFSFVVASICIFASVQAGCPDGSVLGGQLSATGGAVRVEILDHCCPAFINEIWLFSPDTIFIGTDKEVGMIADLGLFPKGFDLVFGIIATNTFNIQPEGLIFLMGDGSNNPDGIPHACILNKSDQIATIFFEDLLDGGDFSFSDAVIKVTQEKEPIPITDCNKNKVGDAIDIASGTSKDCNANKIPDECDITSGALQDKNINGIPDECEIPNQPSHAGLIAVGDPLLGHSWGQEFQYDLLGGFDKIEVQTSDKYTAWEFENNPEVFEFESGSGWGQTYPGSGLLASSIASAEGLSTESLSFSVWFNLDDQGSPLAFTLKAFRDEMVQEIFADWDGTKWTLTETYPGSPIPPPQITHTPIASAKKGQDLWFEFDVTDEKNQVASITLWVKLSTSNEYTSFPFIVHNDSPHYVIDLTGLTDTLAGVDYYIEATDNEGATKTTPVYHICILSENQLKIFDHEMQEFTDSQCSYIFNPDYGTVVFVHGWNLYCGENLNYPGEWIPELGNAISERFDGNVNILAWDWLLEARAFPNNDEKKDPICITGFVNLADELILHREEIPYAKIPNQAKKLSLELQKLFEKKGYSLDKPIQFIGHSLGAHVVAQCAELMVNASKSDPLKYFYPQQITCLDPAASNWFNSLRDICSPIGSIRNNRPEVFTELYDGTANFSSRKFKLFVDVPYERNASWGHDVWKWYLRTVSEDFSVRVYDPVKFLDIKVQMDPLHIGALLPGSVGFTTSCLLGIEKTRPELSCINRESMNYDYLWGSDGHGFTYQGCLSYDCQKVTVVPGDNFISTPKFIIIGEDNGSSFVDNKLELKTKPNAKIEWQFQFDSYFTDSDYFQFEQYWYKEPQAGGGEAPEPTYAELVVLVTSGDRTLVVYESNTDSQQVGMTKISALIDMREFHGLPVTIIFAFTSTDATISAVIENITAYQWPGRNNQAPVADAGDDIDVMANKDETALIQLSSTGSSDPEGAELQYQWSEIIEENEFVFSNDSHPSVRFSQGTHQIRLCVYDEYLAQACDESLVIIEPYEGEFIRGDCNGDRGIDLADAIKILFFLFSSDEVDCQDSCDADDIENVNVTDAIYVLQFLFLNGPRPLSPYPEQGKDQTPDTLTCKR